MSVLTPSDPVPRYARLAQLLRQRIDKGIWKPGDRLPRLEDLMAEFDVARVTVRRAIALLAQEGRVRVGRGRGTLVEPRAARERTLHLETSLAEMADAYRDDQPALTLVDERSADPPATVLEAGTPVKIYRHLRRVHARDGEPYCVIAIYLDEAVFRLAPRRFRRETIIPVLLDQTQVKIARAHQSLRLSVADVETARLLEVPLNSAVGEVSRFFFDEAGRVIYFAEVTYRAEYIRFRMAIRV
jgi:GntR family transcriptional regulator